MLLSFMVFGAVLYLLMFSKKDKEKFHRTRQKTIRILKYITRIIQTKDKNAEKDDK